MGLQGPARPTSDLFEEMLTGRPPWTRLRGMGAGVMWYLQRYGGNHYNGPEGTTFSWFTCFYYLTTTFSTGRCGDTPTRCTQHIRPIKTL